MAESTSDASTGAHYPSSSEQGQHQKHSHPHPLPVGWLVVCIIFAAAAILLYVDAHKKSAEVAHLRQQLDGTNSQMSEVKTDLDRANARATDLQSQMDEAKRQQTDTQAKLTASEHQVTDLQGKLDKSSSDLQSLQDRDHAQTTAYQSQISQANDRATSIQHELDQAKSKEDDLQAQLTKAQDTTAQRVAAPVVELPALPVTTEFKKSFFSDKYTMHIKNTSGTSLKVSVAAGGAPAKTVMVDAGKTAEVGDLAAGAALVISSDGYTPVNATVH